MKKLMSLAIKEEGYDEFLAEQIAKGIAELDAGKAITLDELRAGVERMLQEQAIIFERLEREELLESA